METEVERANVGHPVCRVDDLPPGARVIVDIGGISIAVFNVDGQLFALHNRCPHQGGALCKGPLVGVVTSTEPGRFDYSRRGELLKCPWHGWAYDIRTGQSWCDPKSTRARQFQVTVEPGEKLVKGPYVAETFPVSVQEEYVVVEV